MIENKNQFAGRPHSWIAEQLMSRMIFQKNQLSIYFQVPLWALGEEVWDDAEEVRIPCLICRGCQALAALQVEGGDELVPSIPLILVDMEDGEGWQWELESGLQRVLECEAYGSDILSAHHVSEALFPRLLQAHLLSQSENGQEECGWRLNDWSVSCGLWSGYIPRADGGSRHVLCGTHQTMSQVKQILDWRPPADGGQWGEPIPMEQRLFRVRQGLPGSRESSLRAVRAFAQMPLEGYLREYPESLALLRDALPALDVSATYQEAAAWVVRLINQAEEMPEERQPIPEWKLRGLLECLAAPLVQSADGQTNR